MIKTTPRLKTLMSLLLGTTLFFVLACGGGGGGTSGGGGGGGNGGGSGTTAGWTGGTQPTPEAGVYIEVTSNGQLTDPANLAPNQTYSVVISVYDALGNRTVQGGGTFTLNGGGGAVTLGSDGTLTVGSPSSAFTVTGHITIGATTYTLNMYTRTAIGNSLINGKILASSTNAPVSYLLVELFDSGGNIVGAGYTDGTGAFHAATSNAAVKLGIDPNSVTNGYFRTITYNGHVYATNGVTCSITLPSLFKGETYNMPSGISLVRQADGPPPPPDTCQ